MGVTFEYIPRKYQVILVRAGTKHIILEDDFEITGIILIADDNKLHAILKGFAGIIPKYFRRWMKKTLAEIGIKTASWQIGADEPDDAYKGHDKT